ncbi:mps onebinder kinase activator-like 3 [Rhodotorula toruloides]|uniref:Mps onebinder kinase activator-like 3 n=1 Tax=Rhodotorula toruloides TaxID=5286 RepID=A0A511KL77_RHOTO|nr:mps onebinder kinase activator-like 3 [Rhodotorula toruloides]
MPGGRSAFLKLPTGASPSRSRSPSPVRPDRYGRLRKGTRLADAHETDPFSSIRPFESFTSSFAVQEFITALVRRDTHDVDSIITIPTAFDEEEDAPVELVDEDVWVMEQLRRITLDQHLWIAFLTNLCTRTTCPSMTAGPDWFYVCAAHYAPPDPPCCAIDYISHASDGAQALLCSAKLYRSFAHAFFHHQPLFVQLEAETSLVRRFTELSRRFKLMDEMSMVIPEFGELEEEEMDLGDEAEGERSEIRLVGDEE